jgi:hypothetical protein
VPPETTINPETDTREFPDVMDAETRQRYEKACDVFQQRIDPLAREIVESERLSKDDFAIQINTK